MAASIGATGRTRNYLQVSVHFSWNRPLKHLSKELSLPLSIIFNKSLSEGHVPELWRLSEVTAIFKKGARNSPNNYRPVSLTCVICKVLESLIADLIRQYMENNNFFTDCQHGFRSHRSCVTQLLQVLNDFTSFIEDKQNFDVIYLDFSKAFDSVPHKRLLIKLKSYGLSGTLLKWIESFLTNRRQRVKVNNSFSNFSNVTSGIPQGSILGPILFIIFINDLPDVVMNICKIFADDSKVYGPSTNHVEIQNDLFKLMDWSEMWQQKFNVDKCSVIHYGRTNENHKYYMDKDHKHELKSSAKEKDVGVTFSKNLKFDEHIQIVTTKANQIVGMIKRSFTFMDTDMFLKLYKSVVRPHLEYANVIWHPQYIRQQKQIENVQRRATKLVSNIKDLSYPDRLKSLNLPSIQYRQLRGDLIQTYKILNQLDNIRKEEFFNPSSIDFTRNSEYKLAKPFAKSKLRSNFFSHRVINHWNNLSYFTKSSNTLHDFKVNIDNELYNLQYQFYE